MAFGILQGLQAAAGLSSLFQKPRRSKLGVMAGDSAQKADLLAQEIAAIARGYDPMRESQASIRYAEDSASRALANANKQLNQEFLSVGGNPSGDTAYTTLKRRRSDDILNPLSQFAAMERSAATSRRLDMLMSALGARNQATGALTGTVGVGSGQPVDKTGGMRLLAQLIDDLQKKK